VEIPGVEGKEQRGLRPAIFVADTHTGVAIVIPCTSNLQALRFPFTLRLEPSRVNGFDATSVALVFQLRAIDKKRLVKKVGQLEKPSVKELDIMMRLLLGL
jgi:mRNA interferase MazF